MTIEHVAFTEHFLGTSYCPTCLNTTTNCSIGSLLCFVSEPCDQPEAWQLVVTGGYSSVKKSQTAHGCPGGSYHTMLDAVFQNCLSIFYFMTMVFSYQCAAATAAKSLQSCPTLCNPIDCSPPGSAVPGILQARTLEWVAISFSNAWKWKVKVKSLSRVRLFGTPWTAAHQAPPSLGFSRQEYWGGVPLPSPHINVTIHKKLMVYLAFIHCSLVWKEHTLRLLNNYYSTISRV